jgi:hypothetical protein
MGRIFLSIFALLLISAPVFAGFEDGMSAFERGNYVTALREMRDKGIWR